MYFLSPVELPLKERDAARYSCFIQAELFAPLDFQNYLLIVTLSFSMKPALHSCSAVNKVVPARTLCFLGWRLVMLCWCCAEVSLWLLRLLFKDFKSISYVMVCNLCLRLLFLILKFFLLHLSIVCVYVCVCVCFCLCMCVYMYIHVLQRECGNWMTTCRNGSILCSMRIPKIKHKS